MRHNNPHIDSIRDGLYEKIGPVAPSAGRKLPSQRHSRGILRFRLENSFSIIKLLTLKA
jgi:hypothetical protein